MDGKHQAIVHCDTKHAQYKINFKNHTNELLHSRKRPDLFVEL